MPETSLPRPEVSVPTPEPARPERVENFPTTAPEQPREMIDNARPSVQPIPAPTNQPAPLQPTAAPLQQHVEEVMSAGLADSYAQMDPATQQKFRTVGEETAGKISTMLQSSKIQVKKIVDLLVAWLRIIPGVNHFFLEQEAKIKADKILALKSRE